MDFKTLYKKRREIEEAAWKNNELPPNASLYDKFKHELRNGKIKVDFAGHLGQKEGPITLAESTIPYNEWWSHIYDILIPTRSVLFYGPMIDENYQVELPSFTGINTCGECGEKVSIWWTGEIFELKPYTKQELYTNNTSPCSESGGIKDYTVEIDVPSGRLVFANDFRHFVPEADKDRYVNYNSEIKKTVLDYAESNMLYAFVGNSCPRVYVNTEGTITVGHPLYDDDDNPVSDFGEDCGSICTDLWWFSATDYDYLKKRGKEREIEEKTIEDWVEVSVDVKPGRYQMTVHTDALDDNDDWPREERFVTIVRI